MASNSESLDETAPLKDLTECSVCLQTFTDPKIFKECQHGVCGPCSEKLKRQYLEQALMGREDGENVGSAGVVLICPLCRSPVKNSDIKSDFKMQQLISVLQEVETRMKDSRSTTYDDAHTLCQICEREKISSKCLDCRKWLGEDCAKNHRKFSDLAKHKLVSAREVVIQEKKDMMEKLRKVEEEENRLDEDHSALKTYEDYLENQVGEILAKFDSVASKSMADLRSKLEADRALLRENVSQKVDDEKRQILSQLAGLERKLSRRQDLKKRIQRRAVLNEDTLVTILLDENREELTQMDSQDPESSTLSLIEETHILKEKPVPTVVFKEAASPDFSQIRVGSLSSHNVEFADFAKLHPISLMDCARKQWNFDQTLLDESFSDDSMQKLVRASSNSVWVWGKSSVDAVLINTEGDRLQNAQIPRDVNGITFCENGSALIATDIGLVESSGQRSQTVCGGKFSSVELTDFGQKSFVTHEYVKNKLIKLTYDVAKNTWNKSDEICLQVASSSSDSMRLYGCFIFTAHPDANQILVHDMQGKEIKRLGPRLPDGNKLERPRLCDVDSLGNVLILNTFSSSFYVLSPITEHSLKINLVVPDVEDFDATDGLFLNKNELVVLHQRNISVYKNLPSFSF